MTTTDTTRLRLQRLIGTDDTKGIRGDDYSKPLAVRWLCQKHHREVHRELGTPMGRPPRAGTAGGKITIRATDAELAAWEQAARHAGTDRSTWLRQAALELTETGRERRRGWMRGSLQSATRCTALTPTRTAL